MDNPKKYFTGATYWIILPRILIRGLPVIRHELLIRISFNMGFQAFFVILNKLSQLYNISMT